MKYINLLMCLILPCVVVSIFNYNKIYLPNVNTLIFNKDEMTSFRRTSAIPKLTCVPGNGFSNTFDANNACHDFAPSVIQCKNTGIDDDGQQTWECQADLSDWFSLGQTVVSCEGYNDPNDPYVLSGSCGLEYQLNLTPKGRQHFNKPFVAPSHKQVNQYRSFNNNFSNSNNFSDILMVLIGFPLAITMILWCCYSYNNTYNGFTNLSTSNTTPMSSIHQNNRRPSSVPPGLHRRTTVTKTRSYTPPASFNRPTFVSDPNHVFNSVSTIPRPIVHVTQHVSGPPMVQTTRTVHVPLIVQTTPTVSSHQVSSTNSNEESVNRTAKGFGTTRNR